MITKLTATAGLMLIFFSSLTVKGKDRIMYPAATIDSSLRKGANAICREYSLEFELKNDGKAIERVHKVITILNKNGDDFSELVIPYDKSTKVSSLSGRLYNALGMSDLKLKNNAIQDLNYTSAGAIYDDLRVKRADFSSNNYPYTVEYEYEIEYNGLIGYPEWRPLDDYRLSVENSSFMISYPVKMEIRNREFNLPANCRSEKVENGIHYCKWQLHALTAWRQEPVSPSLYLETPHVITAPVTFTYAGYPGSMNSWKEFGLWINGLNKDRDQLPQQRQNEIREMVKGIKDSAQIVRKLYEYMQSRTHYVGIQLGIGGYQPFPAESVDRLGYGDCKALSNYMKALLNAAGIPSVYTIAGAGSNRGITMNDFTTVNQANHAILCVPLHNDTIWLECTSQTTPCGYMSNFTAGRKVLNITSEGGRVVNTPLLTANQNCQLCNAELEVGADGSLKGTVKTKYRGYQYDNVSHMLTESKKEQEKALYDEISVTGLTITDVRYDVVKDKIPQALETITLTTPTFASKSGTRLFIPLNIFNQVKTIPSQVENRRMPVYRAYAYVDKDSVVMRLPKGFKPESTPRGKTLSSEFGEYTSTVVLKEDQLCYTREFKMNRGTWPKDRYPALVEFYSSVVKADNLKLVLKEE